MVCCAATTVVRFPDAMSILAMPRESILSQLWVVYREPSIKA